MTQTPFTSVIWCEKVHKNHPEYRAIYMHSIGKEANLVLTCLGFLSARPRD